MMKWRKLLIFTAALVMAAALVILLIPSREPHYQGRSLTAWLLQAQRAENNSPDFELARSAVVSIGTNAVPFLLAWTHNPAGNMRSRVISLLEQARRKPLGRHCIPESLTRDMAAERFRVAVVGFRILGPVAAPAAPELSRKLRQAPDWFTAAACVADLGAIGRRGIPYLCEAITNAPPKTWTNAPNVVLDGDMSPRVMAIKFLPTFGTNADCALSAFQQAMKDEELSVAWHAILALGLRGSGHPTTVPALTNALFDRRPIIRAAAADALYRLGPEAKPAVPALLNMLNDEDATVRQWATNALHQIAPEAPTNAK